MKPHTKIAVIGGTGKAGTYLVNQLIEKGYSFKTLVRNPERFTTSSQLAEVITGNVRDYNNVLSLLEGCDAVISTLGMGTPPSEPTIFSIATGNILRAMEQLNIKRYIVITGLNVNSPLDNKGANSLAATQWMYDNYPASTIDKQQEYELLAQSNANWTMVRLPMIELTNDEPQISISLTDCPGTAISATSLAEFLIQQIKDTVYIKQAPFIANK
ncbi:NAD(P)H-binding protein [Flavobacterium sp. Sd200]|uniref:NAD(P)-dependent oxidoreductase n=1 Tax=Flavobacterium sp. Sd200 TaxID=2692211 RepID=UPI00136A5523|nr:NAD(P)H-binding protein [Flavobacterium sp. Sd200]MXN91073.1 NAD(P)H-binding protein [Flavobacterium sp. Sd200]